MGTGNASTIDDPRFVSMQSDPIFKKNRKGKHKVKVDERFQGVLSDDRFRVTPGQVDRYGRKTKAKSNAAVEELHDFYEIETDDKDEVAMKESNKNSKFHKSSDRKVEGMDMATRLDYLNKLSRGEVSGSSSDSDDEDEDNDQDDSGSDEDDDEDGNEDESAADLESER
eukprot:gene44239-59013_t